MSGLVHIHIGCIPGTHDAQHPHEQGVATRKGMES